MAGRLAVLAALAAALAVVPATAAPDKIAPGIKTTQAPMITPVAGGVTVEPLITVGERVGGYLFESIPDGISLYPGPAVKVKVVPKGKAKAKGKGKGKKKPKPKPKFTTVIESVNLYVNHETSLVPFPATLSDFTNAMVSRIVVNRKTHGIVSGEYVIPSSANYQRFCSNFLADKAHGFSRPMLFTNEEATDFVNRTGTAWPAGPGAEQAGLVVAYDVRSKEYRAIRGMGRHNHENSVAIPGYGRPVLLSGDDTFSAPASQLYMYVAASADAVWNDQGTLYALVSDTAAVNDYGDLTGSATVSGRFIPVPREVATGDQNALETWSNANNVFQFIRVEDVAYDRNQTNIVYFADTGEPRALADSMTGRLRRGSSGTAGPYPNGRIFKMVLDRTDPLRVTSLSILIDGDAKGAASAGDLSLLHNPDNVETTKRSLLIQEDPGSQNQYPADSTTGTTARIWRYDLTSGTLTVVARVNQAGDPKARLGEWESSGIVDASAWLGPNTFLLDVQAHTVFVETAPSPTPNVMFKREGGQLLAMRIPGA
jgi:hypothetical protein